MHQRKEMAAISKGLERIIAERISEHLKRKYLISPKHFFPLLVPSSWNKTLDKRRRTLVVALDIAGAFYRGWHKALLVKLRSLGVEGHLLALLEDYYHDR